MILAGPADAVTVVGRLLVEEGQSVRAGEVIAETDQLGLRTANVARLRAKIASDEAALARAHVEARNAAAQNRRVASLSEQGFVSASERDSSEAELKAAEARVAQAVADGEANRADLASAEAFRDLALVRAPYDGVILKVHARAGAKVGPDGIAELGRTEMMYAVAEVYDADVPRVSTGQRARVTSPALANPLTGVVERIGLKVGRLDTVETNPAAMADARVVEVEIRLDDSAAAARLTDLEVEVLIGL